MTQKLNTIDHCQNDHAHLFKLAVEKSDLGVWIHDVSSDHLTWSNRLYETLGVQKHVVPRLDILQSLIHPEDKNWVQNEIAQCLANKTHYSVEYRSIRPDTGQTVWHRCTGEPLFDSRGDSFVMLGTTFDITHLKNAEFKAKAADRAKSEFLANMSHEIRTPMNAIMGMCQMLEQSDLTGHQTKLLSIIGRSGDTLLNMIDEILDFSNIESEKLSLASTPFSLIDCIEDVSKLLESAKSLAPNFELLIRYQPGLPYHYIGDESRLRQVITNLLGNALKFTKEGHVLIDVSGHVDDNIAKLQFVFEDTGIGVPKEKTSVIFDKFEQADNSSTREYGGTGLGLAMAKQIIDLMGGKLCLESKVGTGSRFSFEISMPVQTKASPKSVTCSPAPQANIMIIDDNVINQDILSEQITHWNWTPICVHSAKEGLIALQKAYESNKKIDLILLDFEMPIHNGKDFLKTLRKHSRFDHIDVIVMHSTNTTNLSHRVKNLGTAACISKPPQISSLHTLICKLLYARDVANVSHGNKSMPACLYGGLG